MVPEKQRPVVDIAAEGMADEIQRQPQERAGAGSFMDYAMPRAGVLPFFATDISRVTSSTHPLGFRGGGEGGITPSLGVIVNAIVDALAEFGVTHVEMPATAEKVWRAMRAGRAAGAGGIEAR